MGDSSRVSPGCVWAGNASAVSGALFVGSAQNTGSLGDYAIFHDDCKMTDGTAGDYAIFQDGSSLTGGTVGDYAIFQDGSTVTGGTMGDYATFHDECWIGTAMVGDQSSFNDDAEAFDLSIGAGATFNNSAFVYADGATSITLPCSIYSDATTWQVMLQGAARVYLYGDGTDTIYYDFTGTTNDGQTIFTCGCPQVALLYGIILISGGDVRSGNASYNTNVTGTLAVPDAADVLTGVAVDDTVGSLTLPPEAQVLNGVEYGVGGDGSTGTLVSSGGGSSRRLQFLGG